MKRVGNLWPEVTSFANLLGAAEAAALGKRKRPDVAAFLLDLESRLVALRRELIAGTYRPGSYHTFTITDPKPRQISAAPFGDRVVHHALTRVLEPVFERHFSPSVYVAGRFQCDLEAEELTREQPRRHSPHIFTDVSRWRKICSQEQDGRWRRGAASQ